MKLLSEQQKRAARAKARHIRERAKLIEAGLPPAIAEEALTLAEQDRSEKELHRAVKQAASLGLINITVFKR